MAVHRLHKHTRLAKRYVTVGLPASKFSPNDDASGTLARVAPDSEVSA
jgi:hypothetical protein